MISCNARRPAGPLTRRDLLRGLGAASAVLLAPQLLDAQERATRDFSPGALPLLYPDVLAIDRSSNALRQFMTYLHGGKQYIVVAVSRSGADAYALP